jgi:hypothetical protein
MGWSMTVASTERELKVILNSLKADGMSLDEVLQELMYQGEGYGDSRTAVGKLTTSMSHR